jgi:hypothetical protein
VRDSNVRTIIGAAENAVTPTSSPVETVATKLITEKRGSGNPRMTCDIRNFPALGTITGPDDERDTEHP